MWDPREGPETSKQVVDRLLVDPYFRIEAAVANNYDAVLQNYQQSYHTQNVVPAGVMQANIRKLWDQGYHQAATRLIDVPWMPNVSGRLYDQAYQELTSMFVDEKNNPELEKTIGLHFSGNDWLGIGALSGALSTIGSGRRAEQAAKDERARLELIGGLNDREQAAKAERQKQMLKYGVIALGVIAVIVLLIWQLRKK